MTPIDYSLRRRVKALEDASPSGGSELGALAADEVINLAAPPDGFALGPGWVVSGTPKLFRWGRAVAYNGTLRFIGSGYDFYNQPIIVLPARWLPQNSDAYHLPFARIMHLPATVKSNSFALKSSGTVDLAFYDFSSDPTQRGLWVDNDDLPSWSAAADDKFLPALDGQTFLLPTAILEA